MELFREFGMVVYCADPGAPWQRGTNENTNGLLREFFPKKTELDLHAPADILAVATLMNQRPSEILGFRTPQEAFLSLLQG